MISVIICSADSNLLTSVKKSIAETIGVPFEIISFDNREGKTGICELYNRGATQAKYDLLCFMHEDILYNTIDWGKIVINIFNDNPEIGIVGVAGGFYKPISPSGWSAQGADTRCINLIQHFKYIDKEPTHDLVNPFNTQLAEVACVDGVWFCAPKSIALQCKFDEQIFKGFHCYDLDFSLAVGAKYKVAVTYEVLLTHLSEGKYDRTWLLETLKLQKKWDAILPVNKGNVDQKQSFYIEKITFRHFLIELARLELPFSTAFKVLWQNSFLNKLGFTLFIKLNFHIIKKYFEKR